MKKGKRILLIITGAIIILIGAFATFGLLANFSKAATKTTGIILTISLILLGILVIVQAARKTE